MVIYIYFWDALCLAFTVGNKLCVNYVIIFVTGQVQVTYGL